MDMDVEDCGPPGTEPATFGAKRTDAQKKAEVEIELHILSSSVSLDDGTKARVFSRAGRNQSGWWLYTCQMCGVANLAGERALQLHINGRKHQNKLAQPVHNAQLYKAPIKAKGIKPQQTDILLAPGEPVPPGYEGEVKRVAELQSTLSTFKEGPLLGLEYLLELITQGFYPKEPQYICLLCDKRGDPRTVMAHLVSYNHRMMYLEAHYQSVVAALSKYRLDKNYRKTMTIVVQKVAEAIELAHGRLNPSVVDKDTFEKDRKKYFEDANKDKHFNEKVGPTFIELVEPALVDKIHKGAQEAEIKPAIEKNSPRPLGKKASLSPPKVVAPGNKKRKVDDKLDAQEGDASRKSYESISSISSSSLDEKSKSRSRSRERIRRDRELPRRTTNYRRHSRSRSRSRSADRSRRYYRRSSRTPPKHYNAPFKYDENDPYRKPRRTWMINSGPGFQRGGSYAQSFEGRGGPPNKKNLTSDSGPPSKEEPAVRPKRQIAPTPKELVQQASEIAAERYKLDKYRFALEIVESEMEKLLKSHEKNPENHPLYPEEWKKFWNRRYKELQAEKKDPAKHDFKPEWIEFWTRRMKELHNEELRSKKQKLQEKYQIKTPDAVEPATTLKEQYHIKVAKKDPINDEVIIIDDKSEKGGRHSSSLEREKERERDRNAANRSVGSNRSHSPWDDDDYQIKPKAMKVKEYKKPDNTYNDWAKEYYGPQRSKSSYAPIVPPHEVVRPMRTMPIFDPTESLNVVAVLRLLTALEDLLGSLGPKVVDLLSKALALEKVEANNAENMLNDDDICVTFETVKEKLKGQLFAGMLESQMIQPVKTAIQKIASLLHQASEKARETKAKELKAIAKKKLEPVTVPGVGAVDKGAIAKQIAAALIAQGKTDVTTAQLEQLINAVVGMAQASQGSDRPMTTANYLAQLQGVVPVVAVPVPVATPPVKILFPSTDVLKSKTQPMVEKKVEPEQLPPAQPQNPMEGLSDSDLKTLLQNFSNLSTDEQHGLIMYLKKLEAREPDRVERLRKFVNLGSMGDNSAKTSEVKPPPKPAAPEKPATGRISPFSIREGVTNPSMEDRDKMFEASDMTNAADAPAAVIDSEDDDDYTYDDVFKAASKNVKEKQLQNDMKLIQETIQREREESNSQTSVLRDDISINDAKNLIANLMGSLHKNIADNKAGTSTPPVGIPGLGYAAQPADSKRAQQISTPVPNQNYPIKPDTVNFDMTHLHKIDFNQFKVLPQEAATENYMDPAVAYNDPYQQSSIPSEPDYYDDYNRNEPQFRPNSQQANRSDPYSNFGNSGQQIQPRKDLFSNPPGPNGGYGTEQGQFDQQRFGQQQGGAYGQQRYGQHGNKQFQQGGNQGGYQQNSRGNNYY